MKPIFKSVYRTKIQPLALGNGERYHTALSLEDDIGSRLMAHYIQKKIFFSVIKENTKLLVEGKLQ